MATCVAETDNGPMLVKARTHVYPPYAASYQRPDDLFWASKQEAAYLLRTGQVVRATGQEAHSFDRFGPSMGRGEAGRVAAADDRGNRTGPV